MKKLMIFLGILLAITTWITHAQAQTWTDPETDYFSTQLYYDQKLSPHTKAKATIFNNPFHNKVNENPDWTNKQYFEKSPTTLNNMYAELDQQDFTAGAGIKTFAKKDGLLNGLRNPEDQFYPVDATNPLRMKRMGAPGFWGTAKLGKNTYLSAIFYKSYWSRISADATPGMDENDLESSKGTPGYSTHYAFGTKLNNTQIETGIAKTWGTWPSEENKEDETFTPDVYKLHAVYVKLRQTFGSWTFGITPLAKFAKEKAGKVYNMPLTVEKRTTFLGNLAVFSGSYFYVNSFIQGTHTRHSPWEDLGNSWNFKAEIADVAAKADYTAELIINHEELGFYFIGTGEQEVSETLSLAGKLDLFTDGEKFISDEHDAIRIAGLATIKF